MAGEGAKKILLVGHCGPDSFALRSAVRAAAPGAVVEFANDPATLEAQAASADLLLINRVLDGDFPDGSGIDLIRGLASAEGPRPAMMLVSNYPESQAEAEAAGAAPGFGKAAMYSDAARERIRAALGLS